MISISTIIVTYNSASHIKQCLDLLLSQDERGGEVIVIDNDSSDDTPDILKGYAKDLRLILNKKNTGFAAAINQGISCARSQFILVLNGDVVLKKNFFTELKKIIAQLPEGVGMICSKIMDSKGKAIDSTGLILTGLRRFRDRGRGNLDSGQFDGQKDVFGPCGAAAVYSKRCSMK